MSNRQSIEQFIELVGQQALKVLPGVFEDPNRQLACVKQKVRQVFVQNPELEVELCELLSDEPTLAEFMALATVGVCLASGRE